MYSYNELYHHGILNQKWGVRRYQNPDGSLTEEGKKRYSKGIRGYRKNRLEKTIQKRASTVEAYNKERDDIYNKLKKADTEYKKLHAKLPDAYDKADKAYADMKSKKGNGDEYKKAKRKYKKLKDDAMILASKVEDQEIIKKYAKLNILEMDEAIEWAEQDYKKYTDKYVKKYGSKELSKLPKISNYES